MGFEFKTGGFSKGGGFSAQGGGFGKSSGVDDPLAGVEYSDDLEADAAAELSGLQKGFESRAKAERERFKQATDSEFWFAVCFKSRQDKNAFLNSIGVKKKFMGDKYIDGYKLATVLGSDAFERG